MTRTPLEDARSSLDAFGETLRRLRARAAPLSNAPLPTPTAPRLPAGPQGEGAPAPAEEAA